MGMREGVKRFLFMNGLVMGVAMSGVLYFIMILAFLNGGQVTIDVNQYKEGFFEVFLLIPAILSFIAFSAIYSTKLYRERNVRENA